MENQSSGIQQLLFKVFRWGLGRCFKLDAENDHSRWSSQFRLYCPCKYIYTSLVSKYNIVWVDMTWGPQGLLYTVDARERGIWDERVRSPEQSPGHWEGSSHWDTQVDRCVHPWTKDSWWGCKSPYYFYNLLLKRFLNIELIFVYIVCLTGSLRMSWQNMWMSTRSWRSNIWPTMSTRCPDRWLLEWTRPLCSTLMTTISPSKTCLRHYFSSMCQSHTSTPLYWVSEYVIINTK